MLEKLKGVMKLVSFFWGQTTLRRIVYVYNATRCKLSLTILNISFKIWRIFSVIIQSFFKEILSCLKKNDSHHPTILNSENIWKQIFNTYFKLNSFRNICVTREKSAKRLGILLNKNERWNWKGLLQPSTATFRYIYNRATKY